MLLPVSAGLGPNVRFSRLSAVRHGATSGIKTISIPVAPSTSSEVVPPSSEVVEDVVAPVEPEPAAAPLPVSETHDDAALAEEERKARKAAATREKRRRKRQASKAAAATSGKPSTEADADTFEDEDEEAAPGLMESVSDIRALSPTSETLGGANLTDSGTASSDGKASGVSTPASSHGFAPPQRSLDWSSLENAEDKPVTDDDAKSGSQAVARPSLSNEPPITPRIGRFWGHDERLLEGDPHVSPRWKGRASPAPGDRSSSPFASSSDGGWQEVTKHHSRASRASEKPFAQPKFMGRDGQKGNLRKGTYASPGMRAWADEDSEPAVKPLPSKGASPAPTPSPAESAKHASESPWTARSAVPYLFDAPGSRTVVDDALQQRTMSLRINLHPPNRRGPARTFERTVVSTSVTPAQRRTHSLAAHNEPLRVCVKPGKSVAVYHPAAERERQLRDQVARASQETAVQAEVERQKVEEERIKLEVERSTVAEAEARPVALVEPQQRAVVDPSRLEAARELLAAAMPKPLLDEELEQPVASTSSAAPPAPIEPIISPPVPDSQSPFGVAPPPVHANMFPPGPFFFADGTGPPGLHVFDHNLGMVVPIDPATAAQLFPPMPMPLDGPQSPSDFYGAVPTAQPAFFAPARSSKIEIRAPTPGQTGQQRPPRRHQSSMSNSSNRTSHSPSASRYDAATPLVEPVVEEQPMIPGSYLAGGAVYFNNAGPPLPPPSSYFMPPDFYGAAVPPQHTPDMVDPAILSLGHGTPAPPVGA